jgi:hypothetical protein
MEEIIEALNSGRCALCYFFRKDFFDLLCQWASAPQKAGREMVFKQRSFCNYHFWKLKEIAGEENIAHLEKAMLERFLFELNGDRQS